VTENIKPVNGARIGSLKPGETSTNTTGSSLGQHHVGRTDQNTRAQAQATELECTQRIYQELGLDIPDWLVEKMMTNYRGMTPMERYLAETCDGKVKAQGF
jgi:hypothetical protein